MSTLVDTHTHLYFEEEYAPDGGGAAAVERALEAGIAHMIFPCVTAESLEPIRRLHNLYPTTTSICAGLHPTEVTDADAAEQVKFVEVALNAGGNVAVGEIGVDLYWDASLRERQMEVFCLQLDMANEHSLPVIIHCRSALPEVLEVLGSMEKVPRGVFHSFSGTADDVDAIRRTGDFYFGINGIVTFKNSQLRELLPHIGLERMMVETDAPYLSPVPLRGRRNESAFMIHTAQHIADTMGIDIEEVAKATTSNAENLFGIREHRKNLG